MKKLFHKKDFTEVKKYNYLYVLRKKITIFNIAVSQPPYPIPSLRIATSDGKLSADKTHQIYNYGLRLNVLGELGRKMGFYSF
jgi:hypothetical protein